MYNQVTLSIPGLAKRIDSNQKQLPLCFDTSKNLYLQLLKLTRANANQINRLYLDNPGNSSVGTCAKEIIISMPSHVYSFEQVAKHGHVSKMDFPATTQKPEGMAQCFKPEI